MNSTLDSMNRLFNNLEVMNNEDEKRESNFRN